MKDMYDITDYLERAGRHLRNLLHNDRAVYVLSFLFFFLLFFSIYAVTLRRVTVFQTADKNLSRPGKGAAMAFAGISVTALFLLAEDHGGMSAIIDRYLTPIGYAGGAIVIMTIFLAAMSTFKRYDMKHNWKAVSIMTGVASLLYGGLTDSETYTLLGMLIILITILYMVEQKKHKGEIRSTPNVPTKPGK